METMIGLVVDNYKIIEVIGRGGMGVVFKAIDLNLEKTVALKMIDPFLARDDNFLKRFKTEAKALAKLDNRNIVNVYALRQTELGVFMVMEYVSAITISEWLKEKGKFSVKETLDITSQILNAIGHAHNIGVIHRDIKPNNILLNEKGNVKVMDFGLAKVAQDHGSQATVTYAAAGTLYYMSPEQIKGLKNVDKRSDIYSIGMSIYEMLAGRTPFEKSESEFTIQKQIVDGKIPSPLKFNPVIPKDLVKFITTAIDKDAEKRFQSIEEMQEALSGIKYYEDDEVTKVISRYEPSTNSEIENKNNGRKNKKVLIVVSVLIFAAIFLFSYIMFFQDGNGNGNTNSDNGNSKFITEIKKAKLNVSSNPGGATVLLNNLVYGITPLSIDSLEISSYSVALKLNGYEDWTNTQFKLNEGENSINENLK
ncbi:MAG: PEGA domain-containing protein, partial [Ignavibacteriales bacterium]